MLNWKLWDYSRYWFGSVFDFNLIQSSNDIIEPNQDRVSDPVLCCKWNAVSTGNTGTNWY